jgi:hypothetical protein
VDFNDDQPIGESQTTTTSHAGATGAGSIQSKEARMSKRREKDTRTGNASTNNLMNRDEDSAEAGARTIICRDWANESEDPDQGRPSQLWIYS